MNALAMAIEHRAQTLRDLAADNLRAHRKFRGCSSPHGREMTEWYEGRYIAYKRAAEMIRETVELYS